MSGCRRALVLTSIFLLAQHTARAGESIDLTPRYQENGLMHVSIQLDVGGHDLVRATSDDKDAPTEKKLPSSVAAKLSYDELRLADVTATTNGTPLAIRYYDSAEAVIKVDSSGRAPKLADDRRLIVLAHADQRPALYCPDAPLDRKQLDLIDVVGDSYSVDRLLPSKQIAEGATWNNDASVMGPLLTFDTVAVCEVQSVLDSWNENFAKIRLAGVVHGTADGAAIEQEVRGVYLFDRRLHRVTRLNLAIREERAIGGATPGLDAVAKLQVTIDPIEKSEHLTNDVISRVRDSHPNTIRELSFEVPKLGFRLEHDRQWYDTAETRQAVTLRRVDNGDLAAQCTVTQLPSKSAGRQTSLEQFQKDVEYSLGKNFGEMVSSRQWQNKAGLFCYEVISRGAVEQLPMEWHSYLVAPESGSRVSVVVTIEARMVDRVANADQELVESLELFPAVPESQAALQPAGQTVK
jgi:hypothetical protein